MIGAATAIALENARRREEEEAAQKAAAEANAAAFNAVEAVIDEAEAARKAALLQEQKDEEERQANLVRDFREADNASVEDYKAYQARKFKEEDQASMADYAAYMKRAHYIYGYTEQELISSHQYQGTTNYCGDYSLAMVINLLTGDNKTGMEIEEYMVQHFKQLPTMGIMGKNLTNGARLLLPDYSINYKTGGTIEYLKTNVDSGNISLVGTSWQTTQTIVDKIWKNILTNTEYILHGKFNETINISDGVTVGHWRVVVGYNDSTNQLILLDPGSQGNNISLVNYKDFNKNWLEMENIFIGSGDLITIEPKGK